MGVLTVQQKNRVSLYFIYYKWLTHCKILVESHMIILMLKKLNIQSMRHLTELVSLISQII